MDGMKVCFAEGKAVFTQECILVGTDDKVFTDADQFSSWARESISYAQISGLINGVPGGAFAPKNNATRAENSAVFQRMILAILSETK